MMNNLKRRTDMNERFIGLQKENIIEITTIDEKTVIEDIIKNLKSE